MNLKLNTTQDKQKLRKIMLAKRNALTTNQVKTASTKIINQLKTIPQFLQADSFFIYVAIKNEVQTQTLIQELLAQKKIVCVPKIIGKAQMIPVAINSLQDLNQNKYQILEPINDVEFTQKIDVCLVPGLAFDKLGNRLGMGGGYYDAFLKNHPEILSIGLAYDWQIVNEVPITNKDIQVHTVISKTKFS